MFGFQIVEIKNFLHDNLRIMELPIISTLNVFVKGHHDNSTFHIILEFEGEDKYQIQSKLEEQQKNLKLYLNLITDSWVTIKSTTEPQFYDKKEINDKYWKTVFEALQDSNLPKFLSSRHSQQDIMLQMGLEEVTDNDLFNGFPKLINWLDDNDGKGSSRFCKIRDVCSHGVTDNAILKVNEEFPGEFEFEDNILRRDSNKNLQSIKKYLPEVLDQIKDIFKKRFTDNS